MPMLQAIEFHVNSTLNLFHVHDIACNIGRRLPCNYHVNISVNVDGASSANSLIADALNCKSEGRVRLHYTTSGDTRN